MPLMMDDPLEQDGLDAAAAAVALGSQAMDHEIDMEDLFGADASVAMPALPPPKGLAKRLMELKTCGACQRVAWSRYGPIASISADSKEVKGAALVQDHKTGRWKISNGVPVKLPEGYDGTLKHVCWSFMGVDLAITDTVGRILIYGAALGHSHIELRRSPADGEDAGEMGCIVGIHWLPVYPQAQKIKAFWNAQLEGDDWVWHHDEHRTTGPSNPIESKTALISMSRNGKLRLLYQTSDSNWRELTLLLDDMLFDHDTYLTHASFAPDRDDGMLMVTYDTRHYLRLYKIKIDWALQQAPHQDGHQQPALKTVNPTMKVIATKLDTNCIPTSSDLAETDGLSAYGATDLSQYMLTHLELVAPSFERSQGDQQRPFPTIITAFKHVASILPMPTGGTAPAPLGASSIIWTYELYPAHHSNLSSAFNQLAAKRKGTDSFNPRNVLNMRRLSSIPVPNTILSINATRYNTVLAVSMTDGSVEFLKRDTMEPMQAEYNFSSVYSLSQSGFAFTAAEPVINIELSPNACCALSIMAESGEMKLRTMTSTIVDLANPGNAQQRSATAAVLALQWCGGLFQFRSCLDDISAMIQPDTDIDLQYEIIEKAYSAIGLHLDFTGEEANKSSPMFFKTPWWQRLVGQQAVLQYNKSGRRRMSTKLAYMTLNTRLAAFVTMIVFRTDLSLKPDIAFSLVNMVQWCLDFMTFILQEVDRLSEHLLQLSSSNPSAADGQQPLSPYDDTAAIESFLASENSPALFLLLCVSPRMLVRMIGRQLRHGWIHCINGKKSASTPQTREAFNQVLTKYAKSPICKELQQDNDQSPTPAIVFEQFSLQVDQLVNEAYASAGVSSTERSKVEKQMFVRARIPNVLMPAIKRLLTEMWPKFIASPNVDFGAIYKQDISWLGFTEDKYTQQWQKRHVVDVVKKTITSSSGEIGRKPMRKCTRCGSKMEDIQPGPPWPGWVVGNMKNCICLGNWGEVQS